MINLDPFAVLSKRPRGRFLFLLISQVLYIFIVPSIEEFIPYNFVLSLCFSLLLISAIYVVSVTIWGFIIGVALAMPMIVSIWLAKLVTVEGLVTVSHALAVLFIFYTIVLILRFIMAQERVTANIINASVVVYLLIGLVWALLYSLGHDLDPNSFAHGDLAFGEEMLFFSYYSFITLTTLGYGDVTPIARWAVSLSSLEAVIGQFYIAILVARLVGLHISHSKNPC